MTTGRAAVYPLGPRAPLEIREFPVPDPEPGAVVVRVTTANVCGSDLHFWRGDIDLARLGLTGGTVLGHEMTGRVVRAARTTDSSGKPLAEGDRVVYRYFFPCGHCGACLRGYSAACGANAGFQMRSSDAAPHFIGGFADYYYVPPGQAIFKVPEQVPDQLVAGANCALAQVIQGLDRVGLRMGESVVIQGAGGLGIYATAVAKSMGAANVIVIDGVAERLSLAREFGADATIDISEFADARRRSKLVREMNGGAGADVAVEVVGFPDAFGEGIALLGQGGRYLEIGNISPGMTLTFDPALLTLANKTVYGVAFYEPLALQKAVGFLAETVDRLPYGKLAGTSYSLDQINEAFADADARRVARASIDPTL
ncbi:MAG: zinc-binding dehydrogenase [Actinomycetota bacterium]|nr:zinc-binding dehydrogenase [Actinomycetota bacterium]